MDIFSHCHPQITLVNAYYIGPRRLPCTIAVPTTYHSMDEGFCVPTLDRWFTAPYRVLTKYVKGGPNCDRRYKIYFQLAIGSNWISPKNTELAIFGFEDQTQRLTNIDDEENSWIMDAISTYVCTFISLSPTYSIFRFFKKNMFQLYPFAPKTTEVNSITEVPISSVIAHTAWLTVSFPRYARSLAIISELRGLLDQSLSTHSFTTLVSVINCLFLQHALMTRHT